MKVFIGGRKERREFLEISNDVRSIALNHNATLVERSGFSVDDSLRTVDIYVLFRSFPNEFTVLDIDRFRRYSPLAPIVFIDGELCEGERRTGDTFHGVRRFYPIHWQIKGRKEFELFFSKSGATGLFAKPATASEIECRLSQNVDNSLAFSSPCKSTFCRDKTLILTEDPDVAHFLSVGFSRQGATTAVKSFWGASATEIVCFEPTHVVIDVVNELEATSNVRAELFQRVQEICQNCNNARYDLLVFAPSVIDFEFWQGALLGRLFRIHPKPFDIMTLFDCSKGIF